MAAVVLRVDNARERMAAAWRMACELLELGKPVRVEVGEAIYFLDRFPVENPVEAFHVEQDKAE